MCLIMLFNIGHNPIVNAQLASPVFDGNNNAIGAIQKITMIVSKAIREVILPMKRQISKIQEFFHKAKKKVNAVVANLIIVSEIIIIEKKIIETHDRYLEKIFASPDIIQKWRYNWLLGQLYWESRNVFEVLEMNLKDGASVVDDEGRIQILQRTKKEAKVILGAMRMAGRDANKTIYSVRRTRKEVETFKYLFK